MRKIGKKIFSIKYQVINYSFIKLEKFKLGVTIKLKFRKYSTENNKLSVKLDTSAKS